MVEIPEKEIQSLKARIKELEAKECDREQAEEALKESKERFKHIVDSIEEGLLIVNIRGKILFANKSLRDKTGYTEEDLLGKSITNFLHKDVIPKTLFALAQEFLGRSQASFEVKIKTKSGEMREWRIAESSVFVHEKGKVTGILVELRDVTERNQTERKLKGQMEELKEFHDLAAGRELKMMGLENEVSALQDRLRQKPK